MKDIFGQITGPALNPEDHDKARALITVVSKSTCSLDDAVKLADALGLTLHLTATSKPKPDKDADQDDG